MHKNVFCNNFHCCCVRMLESLHLKPQGKTQQTIEYARIYIAYGALLHSIWSSAKTVPSAFCQQSQCCSVCSRDKLTDFSSQSSTSHVWVWLKIGEWNFIFKNFYICTKKSLQKVFCFMVEKAAGHRFPLCLLATLNLGVCFPQKLVCVTNWKWYLCYSSINSSRMNFSLLAFCYWFACPESVNRRFLGNPSFREYLRIVSQF